MSISDWYCQKCGFKNGAVSFCGECGGAKLYPENICGFFYYLMLGIVFLFSAGLLIVLTSVVPTFADVFASFGAKLPVPTALVVAISNLLKPVRWLLYPTLLGLTAVFAAVPEIKSKTRVRYLVLVSIFLALVVFFIVVAMFTPMFEIGNTVQ